MSSKHFHNDPTHLLAGALKSLTRTNPSVAVDERYKIVYLKQTKSPQVSVISGGGSGHEPAVAAFVGHGMLSGAIAGSIFASPSTEQIQKCLLHCADTTKGIMVIIMNYTGDVMHFGMAVEKARARGIKADLLVVGDDVGVGRARGGRIGRRGIAGTVLVHKIASAAAASGASLDEVSEIANLVSENLVTVGASLSHVHVPGRAVMTDDFGKDDDVEIGMGIHNEEGCKRLKTDLAGLVREMLAQLLDPSDVDRAYVDMQSYDSVVLLINNLGGVSILELGCITEEVCSQLDSTYSLHPIRILTGTFMSSLNGLGFSISILKIADTGLALGSMVQLLDAPTEATGWSAAVQPSTWMATTGDRQYSSIREIENVLPSSNLSLDATHTTKILRAGLSRLILAEPEITKYDTMVGDGDCGLCLKGGAEAILAALENGEAMTDAVQLVSRIAQVVETTMDGTSGAVYAIFFNALAYGLSTQDTLSEIKVTGKIWAKALHHALQSLSKYTPAKPGDRTLVDSLHPFVHTMLDTDDFPKAAEAAWKGCESTMGMEASLGRSVYVGGDDWKKCPDPGAYGMAEFLLGMSAAM